MEKVSIYPLLMANCIKYEKMLDIIVPEFQGSDANMMNVYIDLNSILKSLYHDRSIDFMEYNSIASCVMNIAIHYKYFFVSRFRVDTRVFLVYTDKDKLVNNLYLYDYKYNKYAGIEYKDVKEKIEYNLRMVSMLLEYIPNMFIINSQDFEPGVVIYDMMLRGDAKYNRLAHTIITKDPYLFQLVSLSTNNKTVVIRNKRDDSFIINKDNLYKEYAKLKNNKTVLNVSPELYSLVLAMTGVPERGIKSLYSISTANKYLKELIMVGTIRNGYNRDVLYIEGLLENSTGLNSRFRAIDIMFQHGGLLDSTYPQTIGLSFNKRHDPEAVKHINNTEFVKNPINLINA